MLSISTGIFFGIDYNDTYLVQDSYEINQTYKHFIMVTFIMMFIDVLLNLNTSYYEVGEVVDDRRRIFNNYIRTHLIFDSIAFISLWLHMISLFDTNWPWTKGLQLLFFVKYKNLKRVFGIIEEIVCVNEFYDALHSLFILLLKMLTVAHVFACVWHSIAMSNPCKNWLTHYNFNDEPWQTRYLYSFYWSLTTLTTVGFGDITPQNEMEYLICILGLMMGSVTFGYFINSVGSIIDKISQKQKQFK